MEAKPMTLVRTYSDGMRPDIRAAIGLPQAKLPNRGNFGANSIDASFDSKARGMPITECVACIGCRAHVCPHKVQFVMQTKAPMAAGRSPASCSSKRSSAKWHSGLGSVAFITCYAARCNSGSSGIPRGPLPTSSCSGCTNKAANWSLSQVVGLAAMCTLRPQCGS